MMLAPAFSGNSNLKQAMNPGHPPDDFMDEGYKLMTSKMISED